MADIVLKNGLVVMEKESPKVDVVIEKGKIVKLAKNFDGSAKKVIDCEGMHVLPGAIDVHVHCREPGMVMKEDFRTASLAAAHGGVTTIFDMPNTIPPTITQTALEEKRELATRHAIVNVGLYMGVTDDNFNEIKKAKDIVGVKVYLGSSTGNLLTDYVAVENFFAKLGDKLILVVHAEDEECIREHEKKFRDIGCPEKHSLIRDRECAFLAVKKVLHLAKKYEAHVHITHVTTLEELDLIRKFKSPHVTCDVTPHHLFFDEHEYDRQGNLVKVNPPLRTRQDQEALWGGIDDGIVDLVATDHAPHLLAEKELPYEQAPAGVPGLETMLPLLLDSVNRKRLTISKVVELVSANPAKIFGLKNKGKIEVGCDADFAIVDLNLEKTVRNEDLFTKCKWSPFAGWKLKGWPVGTFVKGLKVYPEC